ncbi:I78 family peptidase inhibitor [Spirillospora sp. NPDC127200]
MRAVPSLRSRSPRLTASLLAAVVTAGAFGAFPAAAQATTAPAASSCDTKALKSQLVGKTLATRSGPGPQAGPDMISEASLPLPYRVLRPGAFITHDFDPDRLNVMIDRDNRIIDAYCG